MTACRTQKADPNEKHVRTRLSALIIDVALDVDSSHLADITVDHAIPWYAPSSNVLRYLFLVAISFKQRYIGVLPKPIRIRLSLHQRKPRITVGPVERETKGLPGSKTKRAVTEREVSKARKGYQRPARVDGKTVSLFHITNSPPRKCVPKARLERPAVATIPSLCRSWKAVRAAMAKVKGANP
jgi:hypothetical protein